ncbi:MAG: rRNA maturation RNase YbeY [Reyranella sp.]|nr:rRNA maturation RNase YbeY [Reyranella sp.]
MTRATRRRTRTAVDVVVLDAGWGKALPGVERLVRKAARAATANRKHSLTVALADDRRVRALNARDRKKDKPTNVLSYPSGGREYLGDVVLARQTVWREAKSQGKTAADHLVHLVVHGTLHLMGYDHETSEADADRMEALERRILAKLGIADPY